MRIQDSLRLAVQSWFVSLLLLFRIEFALITYCCARCGIRLGHRA